MPLDSRRPLPVVTSCRDCGACCTEQAALPLSWYLAAQPLGDPGAIPPELLAELRELLVRFRGEGFPPDRSPCIWYDAETRRCRHYDHRPAICREVVQVGDEVCRRWRRIKGIDGGRRYRIVGGRLTVLAAP